MWIYKDVCGLGGAYKHIHPFKQAVVAHFIKSLPDWVDYVIVFGSATMPFCREDSDIDICIIGDYPEDLSNFTDSRMPGESYDFLFYKSPEQLLAKAELSIQNVERDIYEKGVVVYAK